MQTILVIVLVLLLVGAFPVWPHATAWGWGPAGTLIGILFILLVLRVLGIV